MNYNISLRKAFLLAIFLTMTMPALFPSFRSLYLIPCLILSIYQLPLSSCLSTAFLSGLFLDLLAANEILGLYALNFSLQILFFFPLQRLFFQDSWSTLPLMTYFFSFSSSLTASFLITLLEKPFPYSWIWVRNDLFVSPFLDAGMAFFLFIAPQHIWRRFSVVFREKYRN